MVIYEQVMALGEDTIAVDADDLENDPEGTITAYCKTLSIPFVREALTWESEHKEEWDIWKDYHTDAAHSIGIRKNMETFSMTIDNSDHLGAFYED